MSTDCGVGKAILFMENKLMIWEYPAEYVQNHHAFLLPVNEFDDKNLKRLLLEIITFTPLTQPLCMVHSSIKQGWFGAVKTKPPCQEIVGPRLGCIVIFFTFPSPHCSAEIRSYKPCVYFCKTLQSYYYNPQFKKTLKRLID